MPTDAKLIFQIDALRTKPAAFTPPTAIAAVRPTFGNWTDLLGSKAAEMMTETELLGDFIRDIGTQVGCREQL